MQEDLKKIKNKYGEKMAHLCRTLFPTILEIDGLLFKLLESKFSYSRLLYDDIINNHLEDEFKNYIYSLIDIEKKELILVKSPEQLLNEAGYVLYQCKNEEEIQKFRKYYKKEEELCTFNGNRLDRCYVFFAVRKNVDEIKREDFKNPERQDEYGTSVVSIQFTKGDINTLSIKNRYNHTVNNPDATFNNNLDNIVSGLTRGFESEYNLNINNEFKFEIPGYIKAHNGKYYKYNYEINNVYYCPDNIIIDNMDVIETYTDKARYILIDYFIIDLKNKKAILYDKSLEDDFVFLLGKINKIAVIKDKTNNMKYIIINDNSKVVCDSLNRIICYVNDNQLMKREYLGLYITDLEFLNSNISYESLESLKLLYKKKGKKNDKVKNN